MITMICAECNGTPRTDHRLWCSGRRVEDNIKPLEFDSYDDSVWQDEGGEA